MLTTYLIFVALWTLYRGIETYRFERPQSRPYFVGFLMTELVLAPVSLFIECLDGGTLRERITDAYRAARKRQKQFEATGPKKLIG